MIHGFQTQTEPLTDYERNTLLPVICRGLVTKVGEGMAITNTAKSGIFTSDRTIQEYSDLVWHLKPLDL